MKRPGLEAFMAASTELLGDSEVWYNEHPEWLTAQQIVDLAQSQPSAETLKAANIIHTAVPHLGATVLHNTAA